MTTPAAAAVGAARKRATRRRPPSAARPLPAARPRSRGTAGGTRPAPSSPGRAAPRQPPPGYITANTAAAGTSGRTARTAARQRGGGVTFGDVPRRAPTTPVHRGNYQPVILAEFVAAVLLVALAPVATRKDKTGISPYEGQDMVKLGAITAVYLILALVSTGGREAGRFAAWFGALILLTVGLAEGANLAQELDLFGAVAGKAKAAAAKVAAGGHKK